MHHFNRLFLNLVIILIINSNSIAQNKNYFSHGNIGAEYSIWKPSTLDDHPTKPFEKIKGAGPCYGFSVASPAFKSYALRFSYTYWKQNELEDRANLDYVSLRHLSISQ